MSTIPTATDTTAALLLERAHVSPDATALVFPGLRLTYAELADRVAERARQLLGLGLARGDAMGLLMPNSAHYMPLWLGLTRAGVSVALLNTQLRGEGLAHCVRIVAPKLIIVGSQLCDAVLVRYISHY